ncbi:MAG: hypothetical protein LLG16_05220 [Euryarchaeota archaeon]|nr:hypothetical protein [Euryarchaeota archaeon]
MREVDLELPVDEAHLTALDLSTHILEYANAFRILSAGKDYVGRRRLRYATLLLMFDEVGKLMEIMKDCERAVTMKDPFVKVPGFYSKVKDEGAFENILKELGKSETLFLLFKRVMGKAPSNLDFETFKAEMSKGAGQLDAKIDKMLRFDVRNRSDGSADIPDDKAVDMYFEATVMNAEGAREFIHEWARAKELDLTRGLRPFKADVLGTSVKLWRSEEIPLSQKNFKDGKADFARYEIDLNAKCVCGCMEGNRIHKIYRFPNDYGASVVNNPKGLLMFTGNFRMFVLRFNSPPPENAWEVAEDTGLTDGTIECKDWEEVETTLGRIMSLPKPSG